MKADNTRPFFSIIIVCLNAEKYIASTIESVLLQTCDDFEIIVKDGVSSDKTISLIPSDNRIRIYSEKDLSIYDAMNQATEYALGRYLIYLNCGDTFASNKVLDNAKNKLNKSDEYAMAYGDTIKKGMLIKSPKKMNGYKFYRNMLCHQSIFFSKKCIDSVPKYNVSFSVIADFDLEVRLYKKFNKVLYLNIPVSNYLGDGFSETRDALINKEKERKASINNNYSFIENALYFLLWHMSFPKLRSFIISRSGERIRQTYYKITNMIK